MNDVFISYSRRDKVFTQKLYEALKTANRQVWADWDSIPAASDWDAEIKEGIEQTESMIFVLSPEWVKSNECRKEMVHAVKMGKRLFPILYLPVDPKEVPPELAKINWIYMRDSDDFDKGFKTLCNAMDTDLEWVKTHTRIQVRAVEWDKKKRDNSFVLRGKDLTEGEQFISQGAQKEPEPTNLQGEYILASRKDATRRQRMTLTGVTVALVVSVMLGVLAFFQRQAAVAAEAVAVEQRDRADLNAKMSQARELTAASQNSLQLDPERSILLALQAAQITTDAGQGIMSETENALREAIQSSRVRHTVTIPDDSILSVEFSPDGKLVAAGTEQGKMLVWKVFNVPDHVSASGEYVGSIWLEEDYSLPAANGPVERIAFSPDGTRLATSNDSTGQPAVWDAGTGKKVLNLAGSPGYLNNIAFGPDGTVLATAGFDGMVRVWDASSGDELLTIDAQNQTRVLGLAFSPDGGLLASAGDGGLLVVSDVKTGETVYTYADAYLINWVAFSPKGNLVAFGSGYDAKVLDLDTGKVLNTKFHKENISELTFSPDGSLLASSGFDATAFVVDPYTGDKVFTLVGDTSRMLSIAFSPDGKYLATGNLDGEIKIWDASIISPSEAGTVAAQNQPATGLVFTADGKSMLTSSDEPVAHIFDVASGEAVELYDEPVWVSDVALSPDQKLVATAQENGRIILWDVSTRNKLNTFPSADSMVAYDVEFSPDGKTLATGAGYVDLWNVKSGDLLLRVNTSNEDNIWAVAFNPDGKRLAAGGTEGKISLIDTQTGDILQTLTGHQAGSTIRSLVFSQDGKQLLSGAFDNIAMLWDVESGTLVHTFSGHLGGVTNVALSPDGSRAVTSSSDGTVKVWDVKTGDLVYSLSANKYYKYFWVNNVAFTPDGKLLATGSEDGMVRFYYTDVKDILALAHARVTRSLTTEECKAYLHVDSCPDTLVKPEQPVEKTAGMLPLVPMGSAGLRANSDPALRSGLGIEKVTLEFRNKTTESLVLYWVARDLSEQNIRDLAPSEHTRISVNETTALRVRDLQGNILLEYVVTGEPYQQINLKSIAALGTGSITDGKDASVVQSRQQESAPASGLRSLAGSVPVMLSITNNSRIPVDVFFVNYDGVDEPWVLGLEPDYYTKIDQDLFNNAALRIRDQQGNLLFEYMTDENPVQSIVIHPSLKATVSVTGNAGAR